MEGGLGKFTQLVRTGGPLWGWKTRALPGQDATHCQALVIIAVLQFEMYSGGFSKYEDLSNEFSILQGRFLPCFSHLFYKVLCCQWSGGSGEDTPVSVTDTSALVA